MNQSNDGGPVYVETNLERLVAEPWNAASAVAFLGLVAFWALRLRGRYRRHPFLTACLPVLAAGGVGGALYHAFRCSYAFFLLDIVPIAVLALAVSLFFWARLLPRRGFLLVLVPASVFGGAVLRYEPYQWATNLFYPVLAAAVLVPAVLLLAATRGRDGAWVVLALASFGVALLLRQADSAWGVAALPMGTHWLWHLFGAGSTACLAEYVYRLEARGAGAVEAQAVPEYNLEEPGNS